MNYQYNNNNNNQNYNHNNQVNGYSVPSSNGQSNIIPQYTVDNNLFNQSSVNLMNIPNNNYLVNNGPVCPPADWNPTNNNNSFVGSSLTNNVNMATSNSTANNTVGNFIGQQDLVNNNFLAQ